MTDGLDFKLTGLEDLQAKLKEVAEDVRFKGGRFALRKAAQVVRDKARENASRVDDPKTQEEISRNIVERFSSRMFRRTGNLGFRIGVLGGARAEEQKAKAKTERRRARLGQSSLDELGEIAGAGKGNPGGDTFYWRFLEYGTSKMPAQPFMRPAIEQTAQQATDEFVKQYDKALARAIKRAKKTGR